MSDCFKKWGINHPPIILAPLAGVSDFPFRIVCQDQGADLTYVEMISSTALCYQNKKTLSMLTRHPCETRVGVQVTSRNVEELSKSIEIIRDFPFDTIDINMGCPVKKVVKTGCGSAILKDPERVYQSVLAAKNSTDLPVSAKIRLGWDSSSINYQEVSHAVESAGADWLTVHGRLRNDNYAQPVDLQAIRNIKQQVSIPVIGNGNLLHHDDVSYMLEKTQVDGVMISRGSLGNPWLFKNIKDPSFQLSISQWQDLVSKHLTLQKEAWGDGQKAVVCMKKHLLWYLKGWRLAKSIRDHVVHAQSFEDLEGIVRQTFELQVKEQQMTRITSDTYQEKSFVWDPKYDMDRNFDQAVAEEPVEQLA